MTTPGIIVAPKLETLRIFGFRFLSSPRKRAVLIKKIHTLSDDITNSQMYFQGFSNYTETYQDKVTEAWIAEKPQRLLIRKGLQELLQAEYVRCLTIRMCYDTFEINAKRALNKTFVGERPNKEMDREVWTEDAIQEADNYWLRERAYCGTWEIYKEWYLFTIGTGSKDPRVDRGEESPIHFLKE